MYLFHILSPPPPPPPLLLFPLPRPPIPCPTLVDTDCDLTPECSEKETTISRTAWRCKGKGVRAPGSNRDTFSARGVCSTCGMGGDEVELEVEVEFDPTTMPQGDRKGEGGRGSRVRARGASETGGQAEEVYSHSGAVEARGRPAAASSAKKCASAGLHNLPRANSGEEAVKTEGGGVGREKSRRQNGEVGQLLAALLDPLAFLHYSALPGASAADDAGWHVLRIKSDPIDGEGES